ncbi:unnamed protein product [Spirodela intermedia]|uniref:Uncharacterized protein n=1 Tax=Spirodela intermedia TaxID=51605 RepID=A0A7I8IXI8_SPIIN|nr:unnamed protein product [Spirodela intermedia]CAA6662704.1 unnamed protein product [Spirodela intermedia]CAA6674911.1 unnamed protein product [Spirodela intermedia]
METRPIFASTMAKPWPTQTRTPPPKGKKATPSASLSGLKSPASSPQYSGSCWTSRTASWSCTPECFPQSSAGSVWRSPASPCRKPAEPRPWRGPASSDALLGRPWPRSGGWRSSPARQNRRACILRSPPHRPSRSSSPLAAPGAACRSAFSLLAMISRRRSSISRSTSLIRRFLFVGRNL